MDKLKAQPKAVGAFGQALLDEAKHQIKGYAAELKQEFGGQFFSAASTAAQMNSYVDSRVGMVENRLAAADAAFAILQAQNAYADNGLGAVEGRLDAADMALAALRAQAGPARQHAAEAPPRFCAGFATAQRPVHHHGPCCGSVGGSLPHADEPAQAKPCEGPPGVGAASRAEDDGKPCLCPHVAKLMVDTDVLKIRASQLEGRIDG